MRDFREALPLIAVIASLLGTTLPSAARADKAAGAQAFDYYLLSLSWSPGWCALTGDARGAPECRADRHLGFILHGLWPQRNRGYPQNCQSRFRDASRAETAAMADIMGSAGLAWHEWKAHGRCSGLDPHGYFSTARRAYDSIAKPALFGQLRHSIRIAPKVVEQAFLEANPRLKPDMVTVSCKAGRIAEVRICLTKTLQPRSCGTDVVQDCALPAAQMDPP
ncbi:ribonuclease T [Thioclava sp. BHET1]|nr:ribonuclease T [Thioclava sp. BHET1]